MGLKEEEKINYYDRSEISHSDLKLLEESSLRFWLSKNNRYLSNTDTSATAFGTALHKYILENDKFNDFYFIIDENQKPFPDKDYRNSENKKWKDQLLADNVGKKPLTPEEFKLIEILNKKANECFQIILNDKEIAGEYSEYEVVVDNEKALIDKIYDVESNGIEEVILIDIKSIADISKCYNAYKYRKYYRQLSYYRILLDKYYRTKNFIDVPIKCYVIFLETDNAYESRIVPLSEVDFNSAKQEIKELLEKANYILSLSEFEVSSNNIFQNFIVSTLEQIQEDDLF